MPASEPEKCSSCKSVKADWIGLCWKCIEARDRAARAKEEIIITANALGGMRAFNEYTLEKFSVSEKNSAAVDAVKAFDPKTQNLFIFGPVGTGKTHLAVSAARKSNPRAITFLRQSDMSRKVRSSEDAGGESRWLSSWIDSPLLILDDLGAAKDTEFSIGLLFDVIDGRYREMQNGLIVTSNKTLDQLAEKLGEDRIPSRLAQMCKFISLTGEDHRLGAKK